MYESSPEPAKSVPAKLVPAKKGSDETSSAVFVVDKSLDAIVVVDKTIEPFISDKGGAQRLFFTVV